MNCASYGGTRTAKCVWLFSGKALQPGRVCDIARLHSTDSSCPAAGSCPREHTPVSTLLTLPAPAPDTLTYLHSVPSHPASIGAGGQQPWHQCFPKRWHQAPLGAPKSPWARGLLAQNLTRAGTIFSTNFCHNVKTNYFRTAIIAPHRGMVRCWN